MSKVDIEKLLPFVKRPTRYIGQELNVVIKSDKKEDGTDRVKVALAFPDIYEIGMSNLGLKILYEIINASDNALAERAYSPWTDMEELLRQRNIPLFSIETRKPLGEFDIIGFSLGYELSYSNVLNMLNLSHVPLRTKDRNSSHPLVIAGGPCCFNPEPVADFIDLFVIGDAEEAIIEIIECFRANRDIEREELLLKMAAIDGIYVPSLYNVSYNDSGKIKSVEPRNKNVPAKVKKLTVDIDKALYPLRPLVPFMQVVHNRVIVEIMRGCARGCRFCQAGFVYRPRRERSLDRIVSIAKQNLNCTGYEDVSLSSLSSTDYSDIENLIKELNTQFSGSKVSVSLPSLRANNFSVSLAQSISRVKKSGLTFAPEAGTERLRRVIGKNITDDEIIQTIGKAYEAGWKLVKLYFMIGLPTETQDDIEGIITLVKDIKSRYRRLDINVTVSSFAPKAHTPFQWAGQEDMAQLRKKKNYLAKKLPASVKWHKVESSFLEAVFARGGRRLGDVIERAFEAGAGFDGWDECFKFDVWMDAFDKTGLDPKSYISSIDTGSVLAWDHICSGAPKEFMLKEYKKALSGEQTTTAKSREKDRSLLKERAEVPAKIPASGKTVPVQRMRVKYTKEDSIRFISHLELTKAIIRSLRRMEAPVVFSEGFSPHPKVAFGPALGVGITSDCEYFDVTLGRKYSPDEFIKSINSALPPGIKATGACTISLNAFSLVQEAAFVTYNVDTSVLELDSSELKKRIDEFLSKTELIIGKTTKNGTKDINIRRFVSDAQLENDANIILTLRIARGEGVKPDIVMMHAAGITGDESKILRIKRIEVATTTGRDLLNLSSAQEDLYKTESEYAERNLH
ncbi:MAG: TIGR03960 family B12-binding radical SAM protein [bacterium]